MSMSHELSAPSSGQSVARHYGDLNPLHFGALGGEEGVLRLTTCFYDRVLRDPIIEPLHAVKDREVHALRLSWYLQLFMEVSTKYKEERGAFETRFQKLKDAHERARRRVQRATAPPGAGCPGGPFTDSQRLAWKGHFMASCEEVGLRGGILKDFENFVDRDMPFYGPFAPDREREDQA